MTRTHEIRPDLDEGIDRKVLAQLRARFMALNEGRMARAVEGLTPRQQSVLTLLPLFFTSIIRCCPVMCRAARRPGCRTSNLTPKPSLKPNA